MTNERAENDRANEPLRGGKLAAIVARFQALELRFPAASKGFLSILDQAIFSGTSFLSAAIIGRMTAPDDLGWYYLVLSIVQVVAAIQDNVVWSPYVVYCKRRHGADLAEYSGSGWAFCLIFSAITVAGLLALIGVLSITGPLGVTPGLWALVFAAPLMLLRFAVRRFSFANLHIRFAIAVDIVVAALQLGGLALIGQAGALSLGAIYLVMGAASGLACLGLYFMDPPTLRFVRDRLLPDWRLNWSFAKWALRSYLTGNTTPIVILWILGLTVDATAVGMFGACSTLVGLSNVLLMGVDNVLTPQASHAFTTGKRGLRRILSRTAAFLLLTLGGFCLFVFLSGDWLAVLAFGSDYQGTGVILFVLSLGALMNSISMVCGGGLWVIDHPRSNFLADVSCLVVTLAAAAFLVTPWGVLGAALAILAGASAAAVVRCITLARHLNGFDPPACAPASAEFSRPDARCQVAKS